MERLEREKNHLTTHLDKERHNTEKAVEETHAARQDAQRAREEVRDAKQEILKSTIEGRGKDLTILSLRYEKSMHSAHCDQVKINRLIQVFMYPLCFILLG